MKHKGIGILHPGAMGISVAASAQNTGHSVYWLPQGRSSETLKRANDHHLLPLPSLEEFNQTCFIIISVCPPHSAVDVAQQVIHTGFKGIYADVNAISPEKSKRIGQMITSAGAEYVDGGIVGGPAWEPESTWLYLSGSQASLVGDCFRGGPLEVEVMDDQIGKASAVKMSFAAYTKGTTALLCAIMAAADEMGVRPELEKQWSRNGSDFAQRTRNRISNVTAKAWRFSGEMEEIAASLEAAGLPDGFHLAAQDIYQRISQFKGADPRPPVEVVLEALKQKKE